jgi:hypothetical protein
MRSISFPHFLKLISKTFSCFFFAFFTGEIFKLFGAASIVPDNTPVVALSVKPSGSAPLDTAQLYGGVAPLAVSVQENGTPGVTYTFPLPSGEQFEMSITTGDAVCAFSVTENNKTAKKSFMLSSRIQD